MLRTGAKPFNHQTQTHYHEDHTTAELGWCRSYACESLGYEASDLEERIHSK